MRHIERLFVVSPPSVTEVTVTPAAAVVNLEGPPIAFVATDQYSDGSSADVTLSATWTSSKAYIATVGSNGMATPLSCGGVTTIGATYQGVTGSATLQVGSGPELIAIELDGLRLLRIVRDMRARRERRVQPSIERVGGQEPAGVAGRDCHVRRDRRGVPGIGSEGLLCHASFDLEPSRRSWQTRIARVR